ncbi:MAG: hypothetical protein KGM17_15955 [Sphingomonadales bacterium]|nr:hypothetical protein [Sphingomonadales bacterium]
MNPHKFPLIVLCAGIPRSRSTWVYNAVLKIAGSCVNVKGGYADDVDALFDLMASGCQALIVKSHVPSARILELLRFTQGIAIVSIRDPRDCAASLMEAFDFTAEFARHSVRRSVDALTSLEEHGFPGLCLRYEDAEDDKAILRRIADLIDCDIGDQLIQSIVEELSPDVVKQQIQASIKAGTLDPIRPAESWMEEVHWHPRHIGDGTPGKFDRILTDAQAYCISRDTRPFMLGNGYAPSERPAVSESCVVGMAQDGEAWLDQGFSHTEEWGVWSEGPAARLIIPVAEVTSLRQVALQIIQGPAITEGNASGRMILNGRKITEFPLANSRVTETLMVIDLSNETSREIVIELEFEDLVSPQDLGINGDDRMLGIGLRTIHCTTAEEFQGAGATEDA